jgi:hypothetical protein
VHKATQGCARKFGCKHKKLGLSVKLGKKQNQQKNKKELGFQA